MHARELAEIEAVIPRSASVVMATDIRSTALCSSLKGLSQHGLRAAYDSHLPPWARPAVEALVPGAWTPMNVARAHYLACDALGLSNERIDAIYRESASRMQGTVLSTLAALAKRAGATPWIQIEHYDRTLHRMLVGGAVAAFRVGPKEALVELRGIPLLDIAYFSRGFRVFHEVAYGMFASRVHVREAPGGTASSVTYRVAWA